MEFRCKGNGVSPVARECDDLTAQVILNNMAQAFTQYFVIVGDKYACFNGPVPFRLKTIPGGQGF